MNARRPLAAHGFFAACLLAPLLVSGRASAEETCGDQVCPKGYQCETYDLGCPAIACAPGSECPPCEPGTESVCVPAPCTSDADCADGMLCFTETRQECDDPAPCAGDDPGADAGAEGKTPADCGEAVPTNCTTVSSSSCVPRWAVPCQAAADCGPGFTCEEQLQGGCPGSTGSEGGSTPEGRPASPPDGGGAEPSPDDSSDSDDAATPPGEVPPSDGGTDGCVFEPSGVSMCVPIEVACQSDSDCLAGWTCADNNEGACWASSDGSMGCDPVDPPKVCYPQYSDLGGGRGVAEGDAGGEPTGGLGGNESPTAPGSPGLDSDDGSAAADDTDGGNNSGGCAVSPARSGGAGFGLLALALAGLLGARRRR
jgi:MYXO-CTERM domain-containing protein